MEFNSLMFFFKKKCWYIINTMIWYLYFYFLFVCFCFFLALAPLCIHDTKLCTWEADPGVAVHCWEGFHKWSHWVVHVHTFSRDSLKSGHFAQGPLSFRKLTEKTCKIDHIITTFPHHKQTSHRHLLKVEACLYCFISCHSDLWQQRALQANLKYPKHFYAYFLWLKMRLSD